MSHLENFFDSIFYLNINANATAEKVKIKNIKTLQPIALPTFRCLPCRVKGTPIALDNLPFAADTPRLPGKTKSVFFPHDRLSLSYWIDLPRFLSRYLSIAVLAT